MKILKITLSISITLLLFTTSLSAKEVPLKPNLSGKNFERKMLIQRTNATKRQKTANSGGITPLIVGGVDAPLDAYPWMTALLFADEPDPSFAQFCGGSLVRKDIVVTAAHCVDFLFDASQLEVVVGAHSLSAVTSADRIPVLAITIHPDYDPNLLDNDIALVRLARDATQAPLSVIDPPQFQQIIAGDLLTVMGWGTLQEQTYLFPDILQHVQVPLVGSLTCEQALQTYDPSVIITPNQICAGYAQGGKDSCQGDSGGPLAYLQNGNWYLTGIVSWGFGCARPDNYGVYTHVANYSNWISTAADVLQAPSFHYFGKVGISEENQWVATVTNYSNVNVELTNIYALGDPSFTITENSCTNTLLAPSKQCNMQIKFKPELPDIQFAFVVLEQANGESIFIDMEGIGLLVVDAENAVDIKSMNWYSGGDAVWFEEPTAGSLNGTAMRSGVIIDSQDTSLQAYVEGPGILTFRWKVSSEFPFDFYDFIVDGSLTDYITGEQDWMVRSVSIGPGVHTLEWQFNKDFVFSEGQDSAWLDNVTFERF